MDRLLKEMVWERALGCCEYCLMPQDLTRFVHEIDHIIADKHGGQTSSENLALACFHCNSFKGPNVAGIDSESGQITPLFNPREHAWHEHFHWNGAILEGLSAMGRATVAVLKINLHFRVLLRQDLIDDWAFPPPEYS